MSKLLSGTKIIDLTRLLPGPLCTLYLAELGAEVIKIEPPEGDYVKHINAQLYGQLNYPKDCRRLDLKKKEDKDAFLDLVKGSHVVVESFRPGVTEAIGIDYQSLLKINPSIIYCSITGYGQNGPYRDHPGHDMNYLAISGVLGQMEGLANFQIADLAGGSLSACVGILAALLDSQKSKRSHYIDISMTDCVMALNQVALATSQSGKRDIPAGADLLSGGFPFYHLYETKDGRKVALGALEAKFWKNFCEAVGKTEWISWHSRPGDQYPEIKNELNNFFKTRTMREWESLLIDKECCVSPVLSLPESLGNAQIQSRKMLQTTNDLTTFKFPIIIDQ